MCLHPAGAALLLQQQQQVVRLLDAAAGKFVAIRGPLGGPTTAAARDWCCAAAKVLYRATANKSALPAFAAAVASSRLAFRPDWASRVAAAADTAAAAAAVLPELIGLLANCSQLLPLQQLLQGRLLQLLLRLLCTRETLVETRLELWRVVAAAAADAAAAAELLQQQLLPQLLLQDFQKQQMYYQQRIHAKDAHRQGQQQQQQQQLRRQLLLNEMLLQLFNVVNCFLASEATRYLSSCSRTKCCGQIGCSSSNSCSSKASS
ncbi:hypothetical protein, conserved [Eimeria tenella]|uniref:Uncharacterized protein n=1 Tax=Eimeria tenella TaxID=5802 RepID=U6KYU2_EIMTE|nr:hypothetical protein, conserved [Eimeria tenella]CDJ40675.1 hypothetical protein, conserved [Eimeria tenella]|eukprot:XP_013231425.1 hypothetical protein, conserved [Eimeria tenella]